MQWGSGCISRHGSLFSWNDSAASIKASLVSHLMLLPAHLWGACLCLTSWVIRCASAVTHVRQSRTEQASTKCHTLLREKGSTVDTPRRQSSSVTKLFNTGRRGDGVKYRQSAGHAITFRVFPIEQWGCAAMNRHHGGSFWGVMFPCMGSDVWNERISVAKKAPGWAKAISASEVPAFIRGETMEFSPRIIAEEHHQLTLGGVNLVFTICRRPSCKTQE